MEISLIRHGKSKLTNNNKMSFEEFTNWVLEYDNTGVFIEDSYPSNTIEKISKANIIITSNLKRSIESAMLLRSDLTYISEPLFRETELPIFYINFGGLKLKPSIWTVILRSLWFIGCSRGCESISHARIRAKKAAKSLVEYAREYRYVVLVGHGFFNLLIAKELQKIGWKGKRRTNSKHWNVTTYRLLS